MPPAAPASWPDTEHIDNLPGDLVRYVSGHFRALAQTQLDVIVELLNDRPRKCLGWEKNSRGLSSRTLLDILGLVLRFPQSQLSLL